MFFAGYSVCPGYESKDFPFGVHTGIISRFPTTIVGGGRYEHIQINSINLGGNSGARLFKKYSNKVVGLINGNMNWGSDVLAMYNPSNILFKGSLRTPLSVAFATALKLISKETDILGQKNLDISSD